MGRGPTICGPILLGSGCPLGLAGCLLLRGGGGAQPCFFDTCLCEVGLAALRALSRQSMASGLRPQRALVFYKVPGVPYTRRSFLNGRARTASWGRYRWFSLGPSTCSSREGGIVTTVPGSIRGSILGKPASLAWRAFRARLRRFANWTTGFRLSGWLRRCPSVRRSSDRVGGGPVPF